MSTATYTTDFYLLTAKSNLHVGSGDISYGIVDKLVQRDPIDELPVIHASGMKGAFRELFRGLFDGTDTHPVIQNIFGGELKNSRDSDQSNTQGSHRFFEGRMLSLPVRSNFRPFFRATSPDILKNFISSLHDFGEKEWATKWETALAPLLDLEEKLQSLGEDSGGKHPIVCLSEGLVTKSIWLEDKEAQAASLGKDKLTALEPLLGRDIALFTHDDLTRLAKNLPVIARNHLENGVSKNLWYEEVVPRETRFYFALYRPLSFNASLLNNELGIKSFDEGLDHTQPSRHVQIGANATIGYGLCELKKNPQPQN